MGGDLVDSPPPPTSNGVTTTTSCDQCHKEPYQYICPACHTRTCSLACCMLHKQQQSCTGRRCKTAFLPVSKMTDATLASDYHFLEDIMALQDSTKRLAQEASAESRPTKRPTNEDHPLLRAAGATNDCPRLIPLQGKCQALQKYCREHRQIELLLMPPHLTRHANNQSRLQTSIIFWTVEFQIHLEKSTTCVLLHNISERTPLSHVWEQLAAKLSMLPLVLRLQDEADTQDQNVTYVQLLRKKLPCPAHAPRYCAVQTSSNHTLQLLLSNTTVIEYPTIEVVPLQHLPKFPLQISET
jgi:HIT zinc finger